MSADTPQRSMPRPALPEFRTGRIAAARNGLPEPQPYRYRGDGRSLTPQQAARRLHVLDAAGQPAAKPRCDGCGYLLTRCCRPGGPRGGES